MFPRKCDASMIGIAREFVERNGGKVPGLDGISSAATAVGQFGFGNHKRQKYSMMDSNRFELTVALEHFGHQRAFVVLTLALNFASKDGLAC